MNPSVRTSERSAVHSRSECRRKQVRLAVGVLIAAAACGKGTDTAPQADRDQAEGDSIASEQESAEEFAVSELVAALSALSDGERLEALQALSEAQRQALRDYFKNRSSVDASVSGPVNGEPYPAAWLAPDETP
jgi:hypothetical protein